MPGKCEVLALGRIPYREAWELQDRLAGEIARGERPPALLLLEHPHTFTFGRRGKAEHLLWDEAELARRGVEVIWVDRGGDVTYHGPGQLVGYPLLPLVPAWLNPTSAPDRSTAQGQGIDSAACLPKTDYVGYVRRLERMLILALDRLGVSGVQIDGLTGVWVQPTVSSRSSPAPSYEPQKPAKIAAIGVKVDARGVSRHGFALNVDPDPSYWEGIIGCGLKDTPAACLKDLLDPPPSMQRVIEAVVAAFGQVFGFEMIIRDDTVSDHEA